jgi:hypothetical protein
MNPSLFTRFPTSATSPVPSGFTKRFPLHTEKLIDGAWVAMARFQEPRGVDMGPRVQRHVDAVGGEVRLLRGDVLLATWSEGELTEDFRDDAA